jgi:outer membrane protein OmpA-like peptidoglycan-associated protein
MIRMHKAKPTAVAIAITMLVTGCATIDKQVAENDSWVSCIGGGLLGAVAGAAIGATQGGSDKVLIGTIAGAAVGCGGGLWYKSRVDRLEKIAKEEGLKMQVRELQLAAAQADQKKESESTAVGLEASLEYAEMFPVGSATLTTEGSRKMTRVAKEFASKREQETSKPANERKKVLVVGHTDSAGSAQFNQQLSEQRARAMGQILAAAGVSRSDIYYQGAGSSRPIASNETEQGRAQNRRVEFVEVQNEALLVKRVQEDRASPRYLAHGTGTVAKQASPATKASVTQTTAKSPAAKTPSGPVAGTTSATPVAAPNAPSEQPLANDISPVKLAGKGIIDFGGQPVTNISSPLTGSIQPKSSSFSIISNAYASAPISSCVGDLPRVEGQVKNLGSDQPLAEYSTEEYLPGLNGKPWVAAVNGHVASVGPVAILRDEAKVSQQPFMQFIPNYKKSKKQTEKIQAVANTYEGETQILYRVFAANQTSSPVSCMDIVFDKRAGTAVAGEIYYPKQGEAYVAQYLPKRR